MPEAKPSPAGHDPALSAADAAKLAALKRTKAIATGALVLSFCVFLLAKHFEPSWPWLGFIAAMAEAATIGGLADWYAVVALFKHPLGVPIPHTAIIPENQNRIADNLGHFIEQNFLGKETVEEKLKEVDFAQLVADWLSDPERAQGLSSFVARLVPQTLNAIDQSGLRDFVSQRVLEQIDKVPVAPIAAELLSAFTEDNRHHKLFDELTRVLGRFLKDEAALDVMREKIREELPSIFNLFRADAYLLKRIINSASTLLDEARDDKEHPMRAEFDAFVKNFVEKLRNSKQYARRAEQMKRDLLARPELHDLANDMWQSLRRYLEQDSQADNSMIRKHLAQMFVQVGKHLAADPVVRADMNKGFVVALSSFVESQKGGVSSFIAQQVKRWDLKQLVKIIEINVGRDLQFIRFNGMAIGALAGLALYCVEKLVAG